MAKRVEGVTEKLLKCAKEEFLEKGYENASLRLIAERANSSKGAIYIRYADKESLFAALVEPAANGLINLVRKRQGEFTKLPESEQTQRIDEYSDTGFSEFIEFIYDNIDAFKLILTCSNGSIYNDFIHRLVEVDVDCIFKYVEATGNDAVSSGRLTRNFAHLASQAFYTGALEVVVHDLPIDEATEHINRLRRFYTAGWMTVFNS